MNKKQLYESIMRNVSREVKKVLNEAEKTLTPEDKIEKWITGERDINLKACSPEKLRNYYDMCKDRDFKKGIREIEAVAKSKHVKLNESFASIFDAFDYYDTDNIDVSEIGVQYDGMDITNIKIEEDNTITIWSGNPDNDQFAEEIIVPKYEWRRILDEINDNINNDD